MRLARIILRTIGITGMLCLDLAWAINSPGVSAQQPVEKGQVSEVGIPMPGTVKDFEDTRKQPDITQMHSPESNQQVTVGGAQSLLEGEVWKIDGQYFEIKKTEGGERVRVVVNQDTNLDCATSPTASARKQTETLASDRIPSVEQMPKASTRQLEQGQRADETARGAGFRIGQCDFHPGDRVKAEIDDLGRVTTLKYLASAPASAPRSIGESAGTGELAIPGRQEKPGQLDMTGAGGSMPKEYAVLPIPVGEITTTKNNVLLSKPVKNLQGKTVGTLENFVVDTHSGRIEYAIVALEGGTHLQPVPWSAIQLKRDRRGTLTPMIDTSKYQLTPSLGKDQAKDLSPSVKELVTQMEVLRDREPRKSKTRELVVKEPAIGGPHGEEKAGGGGLSGERALPPEKDAPSFKREKDKRD